MEANGMQFNGAWSLDSEESGFEQMQSGINARAIDFAKFGRLYLKNGSWNGSQLIPATWVVESTQEDSCLDRPAYYYPQDDGGRTEFFQKDGYYKYFWLGLARDGGQYNFFASGHLGQLIYISPQADLILVRNGEEYPVHGIDLEGGEASYQLASAMGNSISALA